MSEKAWWVCIHCGARWFLPIPYGIGMTYPVCDTCGTELERENIEEDER